MFIIAPVNCVVIDKSVLPVDCNNLSNDTWVNIPNEHIHTILK